MTIWFCVQQDRDGRCLGIRSIDLDSDSADLALWEAQKDFKDEIEKTGWPIWVTVTREVEDL